MPRFLLLLNRASGGNERGMDADEVCREVEAAFRAQGHEIESRKVDPRLLDAAIQQAISEDPDGIIAAGGDGTVSAAARQLGGTEVALGVLPMGTFNLAARDLGVPLDIPEAADFLAKAQTLPIDVLNVNGHACLCTTILGFYPEFARTFEKRDHGGRWWKKAWKLATRLPATFSQSRSVNLSWDQPDGCHSVRTKFSAFVPGRYRATAGLVPARTDFNSGTMTAYIGRQKIAGEAIRGMLDYVIGRQDLNPDLTIFRTSQLLLHGAGKKHSTVMIDGEVIRLRFPLKLEIQPNHLKVLTTPDSLIDPDSE